MKICVMGMGYIGLPTAALMARAGHDVVGVDVKQKAVDTINSGHIHIIENGLEDLVREVVAKGKLKAQTSPCEADAFILAVPTPVHEDEGHTPGLEYVDAAAQSIAPFVKGGNMVILESTSPVGTTERISDNLAKRGVDVSKVFFAHCPERVIPGRALIELVGNDRIIGGVTPEATKAVKALYATFVKGELLETNSRTAEMSKLTENSFRDVNIAFANELSIICDDLGIDTMELIRLANHHPRVNILTPGCGVGGHCIRQPLAGAREAHPLRPRGERLQERLGGGQGARDVPGVRQVPSEGCDSRPGLQAGHRRPPRLARDQDRREAHQGKFCRVDGGRAQH